MDSEWITDRRPTEADADADGDVRLRKHHNNDYSFAHWSYVAAGAPWQHTYLWKPPTVAVAPEPAAPATQPRRFVAISRTMRPEGGYILDAIDEDGVAWCQVVGVTKWLRHKELPAREVPADA